MTLTASVVLFNTPVELFQRLYECVTKSGLVPKLYVLDNSPHPVISAVDFPGIEYRHIGENLGYGKAHNIAFDLAAADGADYHVVLNPDIWFPEQTLELLASYMEKNSDVGLVMPDVRYPTGELQYLCKLLPSPMDLFGRRFLRPFLPRYVEKRDSRLELRRSGYATELNVPWLSGCFMFLRVESLKSVGGFDRRFFMYAEDIDLSRRIHEKYRTMYYPAVSIIHDHAKESFRSKKLMLIHAQNVARYFFKWGWFVDRSRTKTNHRALEQLDRMG